MNKPLTAGHRIITGGLCRRNNNHVCPKCKISARSCYNAICPRCCRLMLDLGEKFRIPKKHNSKAWRKIQAKYIILWNRINQKTNT